MSTAFRFRLASFPGAFIFGSRSPRIRAVTALCLVFVATVLPAAPASGPRGFHVAPPPAGNDQNNGQAAAPFATLERARLAVRALLASGQAHGEIVVTLRGGTYELAAPVRFEAADSGKADALVVYRAAAGEQVLLSGGRRVRGWTRERDGAFRAEVGQGIDFRQLWIDGQRAIRARTPNAGLTARLTSEKTEDGLDLPRELIAGVALRPDEVEIAVSIAWMHKRLRISRLAENGETTRAVINPLEWDGVTKQPQGDRVYLGRHFWLENAREFLNAPGEFFLDRRDGALRYRPRPDEEMAHAEVIRPELESLIVLDGRLDAPVHHLKFEGLTFVYTGWTRPNRFGFVDVQANSLVPAAPAMAADPQYRHNQRKDRIPAAFQATTSDHIVITRNRFARLGGAGIVFSQGGDDNVIEGNSFHDLSAGGIELGEDAHRPATPRLFPRRNRIANNLLSHLGEEYFGSVAILGYYTDASLITHNEISGLPYTAISQGWGWGLPLGLPDARANRITSNRVSNFMRRLDDGGGIYTTDRQLGSEIAFNYVERMTPPDLHSKAGGALYPDQFTEGFHIHHNVVMESTRWLYLWNPNIHGNRVEMNYADTTAQRNDGPDNAVEAVNLAPGGKWPGAAQAIIASAGIEPAYASAREFLVPRDVVVESTSVDFQALTGEWGATAASTGRYAGTCQESKDADATARWIPRLPRTGRYEVSAWLPAGPGHASYTIYHADGSAVVTAPSTHRETGWFSLGTFPFDAALAAEVKIAATGGPGPLLADALRFRPAEAP